MTDDELNQEITSVEAWRKSLFPDVSKNSDSLFSGKPTSENAATLARQSLERLTKSSTRPY